MAGKEIQVNTGENTVQKTAENLGEICNVCVCRNNLLLLAQV